MVEWVEEKRLEIKEVEKPTIVIKRIKHPTDPITLIALNKGFDQNVAIPLSKVEAVTKAMMEMLNV